VVIHRHHYRGDDRRRPLHDGSIIPLQEAGTAAAMGDVGTVAGLEPKCRAPLRDYRVNVNPTLTKRNSDGPSGWGSKLSG
jgi:hypothetical protein